MRFKLVSILLLFLFSCAKEGKNIYIEGRVVNPITGEGIPNVRLLLKKVVSNIDLTTESKVKQEAISDADGNFILKHNGIGNFVVSVEFLDDGYHFVGWKDESGQTVGDYKLYVTNGELMKPRLELLPYANVKYDFNNVNCFDANDLLRVYLSDDYGIYLPNAWEHLGCVNYQGNFGARIPMGYYYIHWQVVRNNLTTVFYDTIFLDSGEMKTYTINY